MPSRLSEVITMKNALSYWKKYDLVFKHFSFTKIYKEILSFAKELGKPFAKKSNKGRNFKIEPEEYVAYITFEIITHNSPFRDMEMGSELYVGKHIDHSTFGKVFQKIPYLYFLKLLEMTSNFLENLLGKVNLLIADSTGMHSNIYYDSTFKIKESRRKRRYKINALVASYPEKNLTYIRNAVGSDLRLSDSEGARRMLEKQDLTNCVFIADRGYDFEKVYKVCKDKNIKANIKAKKYESNRSKKRKLAMKNYDEELYKQKRGVVETIFGGLRNKGLLNTRFRKVESINKHSLISIFRHNLFTILRFKIGLMSYFVCINRQTLFLKINNGQIKSLFKKNIVIRKVPWLS